MPPRKEIWDELTRIWGQAEPIKADPPATPRAKLNRTAKIILKTASITSVITTLIIAASVITAFTFINSSRSEPNARPSFNIDQSTLNHFRIPAGLPENPGQTDRPHHLAPEQYISSAFHQDIRLHQKHPGRSSCGLGRGCGAVAPLLAQETIYSSEYGIQDRDH